MLDKIAQRVTAFFRGNQSFVLCSRCFQDTGLRIEAELIGKLSDRVCPNCSRMDGYKLDAGAACELAIRFFVELTAPHRSARKQALLGISEALDHEADVNMRKETRNDWKLLKSLVGGTLFYQAPRLFYLGVTNHLDGPDGGLLKETVRTRIIPKLRTRTISEDDTFYRIRMNVPTAKMLADSEFDSPPLGRRRGFSRFDSWVQSVLYGSPSLRVCLHESRVTFGDNICVATLRPTRLLTLVDLTGNYDQPADVDPFDDLAWLFHGLMSSSNAYSYRLCRRIAHEIVRQTNVNGIVYNSFFTPVVGDEDSAPAINYAVFGNPVATNDLNVVSINVVKLEQILYRFSLGPTLA